jgi:AcrR family transcriptional regulator
MPRAVKDPSSTGPGTLQKRRYDSSRRQAQARETQRHIATVARQLFIEQGYAATSIRDIADQAEVSVQTIYNAFDGKPAIIARICDMAVVGDDEPVALAEREEVLAIPSATDPVEVIDRWLGVCIGIFTRFLPILPAVREAAGSEPEVAAQWRANGVENRYEGARKVAEQLASLGGLRAGLTVEMAADLMWTYASFETAELLIVERGWTPDAYTEHLASTLATVILEPPSTGRAGRPAARRTRHR